VTRQAAFAPKDLKKGKAYPVLKDIVTFEIGVNLRGFSNSGSFKKEN